MSEQIPDDLIYAAFFFVDIVGLSNPILSTETQRTKIRVLNENIYNCKAFFSCKEEDLFMLPTGDGMLIGFKDGLEEPIKLAIELHKKLYKYNQTCPTTERIQVRIGCNIGHIFIVKDVKDNVNLWGPGAILARRVMDLGDEDHILMTSVMAEDLIEISDKYSKMLHPIQDYKIKHGQDILLYTAYNDEFGNPNPPKKIENNYAYNKKNFTAKNALCEKIVFNTVLKQEDSNYLKHERTYHISNYEAEPIYEFIIGILTNSEQSFEDLGIKIFEDNNETKISELFVPTPISKHALVKFINPVLKNERNRIINFQYTAKELTNHFEHIFLNGCKDIRFNFTFASDSIQINPRMYYIDNKNITKTRIEHSTSSTNGLSTKMSWEIKQGVSKKDLIRLEW